MQTGEDTTRRAGSIRDRFPLEGRSRLVLLSFLMLFVELGLIRWSAENVLYLAFFSNLVLIGSFLGIGIGFLRASKAKDSLPRAPLLLAGFIAFVVLFPAQQGGSNGQAVVTGLFGAPVIPGWIEVPAIFLAVVAVMAAIAQAVAKTFSTFESLDAYRLDILGSLGGVIAFSVLAFLGAPPAVWALFTTAAFLMCLSRSDRKRPAVILALAALIVVLGVISLWPNSRWSPYYRITTKEGPTEGSLIIHANGRPHQSIVPVDQVASERPFYLFPYQYIPGEANPGRVLIIGAGSGTDVAVALSKNASSIDAVEIDPQLHNIGVTENPDHPYQDPRVHAIVNDGRAFLEGSNDQKYDLILLALPDSLTLVGGQGSLRLENYLFTLEAMQTIRDHLAPGGTFAMYNYYGPYSFARNAATIQQVFGRNPCVDLGGAGAGTRQMASFTVGLDRPLTCTQTAPTSGTTDLATDDHPFPYLATRTIPSLYLVAIALILLVSVVAIRRTAGPLGQMRPYLDLFFMGAAFLLLETKSVVQFALLFGTTWLVNALVFAGVLLAVLAAISVARRYRPRRPALLYGLLLLALIAAWTVPPSALLELTFWPRFAAATVLAFTPIFLANLVFAERFRDVGSSTTAFGANLLGAMLGGVLEYLSLVTGYRALLVVVAILYGLAFLAGRVHLKRKTLAATSEP